ncbi:MAG: alpha/beta hydrolase [Vicinamibacterales bacterium]
MTEQLSDDHISRKRVVYCVEGMERVGIRKDLVYRTSDAGPLTMDLYHPPGAFGAPLPAVVLVAGYNDVGYKKMLGCRFKDMAMSVSWAQLAAASGMIAIAYTNREPVSDLDALLEHVRQSAAELGIDQGRIAVHACSGSVPLALWALMQHDFLRCGVLLYGYMIDLDGASDVATAAAQFRFVNPAVGRSINDLRETLPLFIARAGLDQFPGLNESIDRFVMSALALNRPLTLVNHATGPHAFDILQDDETSREIVRRALGFLASQLTPAGS